MDLGNDHWQGWLVAGKHLVTPTRQRITAAELAHLVTMHRIRIHFETIGLQAQAKAARSRSAKRREQLVRVVVVDLDTWRRERGLGVA